jgi:hypothetical protein
LCRASSAAIEVEVGIAIEKEEGLVTESLGQLDRPARAQGLGSIENSTSTSAGQKRCAGRPARGPRPVRAAIAQQQNQPANSTSAKVV